MMVTFQPRQVHEIAGRFYFITPDMAHLVVRMGRRRAKVWLARNWRRTIPVVPVKTDEGETLYVRKSGTHP